MDSYVVRIYRRDPKDPRKSVGVVEQAEGKGERAFHNLEELIGILALTVPGQGRPERKKKGKGK